jgi:hypothetical protein
MGIIAELQWGMITLGVVLGVLAGGLAVFALLQMLGKLRASKIDMEVQNRVESARREADTIVKEARLDIAAEQIKKRKCPPKKTKCVLRNRV